MQMRLKLFHDAKAPLANGHRRETLLMMSDEEMEANHGYIQWAFPTHRQSKSVSSAPVLDLHSAIWLAENDGYVCFVEDMTEKFLGFLKRSDNWKHGYNHNQLRIARVIESLRLLHSYELAQWFHQMVLGFLPSADVHLEKSLKIWDEKIDEKYDRIAGCFVGLAIGDALGAPVEFCERGSFEKVTSYRAGGKFNLPAGAWTDDTAMALALAQSLIENDGFDPKDLLTKFSDWMENGTNTSTGVCVGVGQNTLRTLGDFRRLGRLEALPFGSKNDGNGSIMRLAPVPCKFSDDIETAKSVAAKQSRTTHASHMVHEANVYISELLARLINGEDYANVKQSISHNEWSYAFSSIIQTNFENIEEKSIPSTGFVIDTLRAAIWAIENSTNFEDAVLLAVNLGDDADTTAAVTGQIAGAICGYSSLPPHLRSGLIKERELYVTSQFLR